MDKKCDKSLNTIRESKDECVIQSLQPQQTNEWLRITHREELKQEFIGKRIEKNKPLIDLNDSELNTNDNKLKYFSYSNQPMDESIEFEENCRMNSESEDHKKMLMSPIEEFRTDGQPFKDVPTSTPTSKRPSFPELNLSNISNDTNDSDFMNERQISRFQFTDEFIHSFDSFELELSPNKQND